MCRHRAINSYDCGLFAIAYAVELVHGSDPAVSHLARRHLEEGISHNYLDPFPTLKKRRVPFGRKIKLTMLINDPVFCLSQMVLP